MQNNLSQAFPQDISTSVRYLSAEWKDATELPRIGDRTSRRKATVLQAVGIKDARSIKNDLDLDSTGFDYYELEADVVDFHNEKLIRDIYYPQIAQFAKESTQASEVFITNHLVRTEDTSNFNKAYARFVHCDYGINTARSVSETLVRNRGKNLKDYANAEYAWFNSWQPFDHTVEKNPLCVLDARTIQAGDVLEYIYTANQTEFRSSMPMWNPSHQFYYVSEMKTDEVLLIKQLDTRDVTAKYCPHTSFDDPNSSSEAPPRRSIEVRMMCVFN